MELKEIKAAVLQGDFDDVINELANVVKLRKKYVDETMRNVLSIDDAVMFQPTAVPKSLSGQVGIVRSFPAKRVEVEVTNGANEGAVVVVSAHMLERVE